MPKEVVKWGVQQLLVAEEIPTKADRTIKIDGKLGEDTIKGLQEALGVEPDGKIGEDTVTALQNLLNDGGTIPARREMWFDEHKFEGFQEDDKGNVLPLPPGTYLTRRPNLEVVWSRMDDGSTRPREEDPEGWVQIGIDIDMVDLTNRMRYTEGVSAKTFYTDKLTRHQINDLIRTLKRSRNAAYGSDE